MKPAPKQSKVNFINSLVRFPSARRGLGRWVMMDPSTTASLDMRNNWFLAKQKKKEWRPFRAEMLSAVPVCKLPRLGSPAASEMCSRSFLRQRVRFNGFPPFVLLAGGTSRNFWKLIQFIGCCLRKKQTNY